ncbi:ParB/RepB/Spo0J family partition protein [Bosea sp. MMO-172]|uniref:ParB/RepB/Spo0J family partition protein n=1 Tax=Bosea sp. MMO-172 TaxID=3127885 RepID=UPI0030193F93
MAKANQKITLSPARDIPFDKLVLSQSNVRRVKAGISIEELAEDIARRGTLLQSLNVRPMLDADGNETGMFEVPAGGRRYQALALLVKQKRFNKTSLVPCVVRDAATPVLAEDDSLAENTQRVALHPLDQFRAFLDMRSKGMGEEAIAAAFFTTVQVVKQRLRLAAVAPSLLDVYAEDGMTLDMLMAFTVSPDHARQEQVWETIRNSWQKEPYHIRRMLTETTVPASDKRALFVGAAAYEAEGGIVLRDLFQQDGGGWFQDIALLDRMVADKLKVMADETAGEGWKWIEASVNLPYGHTHGLRRIDSDPLELTEDEQAAIAALEAEQEKLTEEYQDADELPDEVDARLGEIEAALEQFEQRPVRFRPDEIGRAGAFVTIGTNGSVTVDRGYIRPEDEPVEDMAASGSDGEGADGEASEPSAAQPAIVRTVITLGGEPVEAEDDEDDAFKPLPERLVIELTAYRTLALANALAEHPQVAMTMLLHKLVRDAFHVAHQGGCLQASVRDVYLGAQGPDLKDSPAASAIEQRRQDWRHDIPTEDEALWDWLVALDEASRMALLAHCVSAGVNALYEKPNPYSGSGVSERGLKERLAQADRLARATGLDLVEAGWRPTVGNYLGRVTKARILEAVREGAGERAAQLIDHMKKGDMAKEAERLLADTGWLPEPLRVSQTDDDQVVEPGAQGESEEALPDFLTGDDEDEERADNDDDRDVMVAAE